VACGSFPCLDVRHECYIAPGVDVQPERIKLVLISEAAPPDPEDYYYRGGGAGYERSTLMAFRDAGLELASFEQLLEKGVYLTSAVKCAKTGYGIKAATIKKCSLILERELDLFPEVRAWLLMGDVAIKAVNYIAKRTGQERVIPAGSTYKIRGGDFTFRGAPAFPSYLQVGSSYGIEKSKQRMIAEDIAVALKVIT
jgi:hypothetical protein